MILNVRELMKIDTVHMEKDQRSMAFSLERLLKGFFPSITVALRLFKFRVFGKRSLWMN